MSTEPLSRNIRPVTALSRLVDARVRAQGLSNRQVADLSQECPVGTISQGAVGQYRTGRHPDSPSDKILRVLSWTLEIPLREMQHAAGMKETLDDWVPPPEAHQMTRAQRDLVERLIKMLVDRDEDPDWKVTYLGTRDLAEEPPPVREPSAEERGFTGANGEPANGPSST